MTVATSYLEVPGGRLHVVDEGSGPPILLLHPAIRVTLAGLAARDQFRNAEVKDSGSSWPPPLEPFGRVPTAARQAFDEEAERLRALYEPIELRLFAR